MDFGRRYRKFQGIKKTAVIFLFFSVEIIQSRNQRRQVDTHRSFFCIRVGRFIVALRYVRGSGQQIPPVNINNNIGENA
jgi:hypothetical protein